MRKGKWSGWGEGAVGGPAKTILAKPAGGAICRAGGKSSPVPTQCDANARKTADEPEGPTDKSKWSCVEVASSVGGTVACCIDVERKRFDD